jgi:hypothetical protein
MLAFHVISEAFRSEFEARAAVQQHRTKHRTGTAQCLDSIAQYLEAASNGEALIDQYNAACSGLWAVH